MYNKCHEFTNNNFQIREFVAYNQTISNNELCIMNYESAVRTADWC